METNSTEHVEVDDETRAQVEFLIARVLVRLEHALAVLRAARSA